LPRFEIGDFYAACKDGSPLPVHCTVIDLASGKVYPGIKSIKQRLKEIERACSQIASLWPGVTQ
jgi:hypothetical protein